MADDTPTTVLREEHRLILKVIDVLEHVLDRGEAAGALYHEDLAQCVSFFRLFADACHHGKEEDLLFPELEARGIPREGGPIGVMLQEHQQGRQFIRQMDEHLEAARKGDPLAVELVVQGGRNYIALLRNHIAKEDQVLFMMADRVIEQVGCQELCGRYAHVCRGSFEGQTKLQLQQIAEDLAAKHLPSSDS